MTYSFQSTRETKEYENFSNKNTLQNLISRNNVLKYYNQTKCN